MANDSTRLWDWEICWILSLRLIETKKLVECWDQDSSRMKNLFAVKTKCHIFKSEIFQLSRSESEICFCSWTKSFEASSYFWIRPSIYVLKSSIKNPIPLPWKKVVIPVILGAKAFLPPCWIIIVKHRVTRGSWIKISISQLDLNVWNIWHQHLSLYLTALFILVSWNTFSWTFYIKQGGAHFAAVSLWMINCV